jgi:hypothetical protein
MIIKLHSSSTPAVLIKLDITKAFDTVEWPFLMEVPRRLGFGTRILACICALLSTASTRVLLNGCPGSRIANGRGLRQGDPLSPQLFILVMEILHLMIEKASSMGLLTPLAESGLRHCTSIYADDVVVFLRPVVLDLKVFARSFRTLVMPQVYAPTWRNAQQISSDVPVQTKRSLTMSSDARWFPFLSAILGSP